MLVATLRDMSHVSGRIRGQGHRLSRTLGHVWAQESHLAASD